jgi:hypothetical protein
MGCAMRALRRGDPPSRALMTRFCVMTYATTPMTKARYHPRHLVIYTMLTKYFMVIHTKWRG